MAEPQLSSLAGPVMRFSLIHYRRSEHTHEAFMKWIVDEHLPLAMPVLKRHGMLSYTLFVTPEPYQRDLKAAMYERRPTWDYADFDCFIEYTMTSPESIQSVIADPEWSNAVKDEEKWVDISRSLCSLGVVTAYMLQGEETENFKTV